LRKVGVEEYRRQETSIIPGERIRLCCNGRDLKTPASSEKNKTRNQRGKTLNGGITGSSTLVWAKTKK